jgi:DNA-binding transcriptional LysR family regulator
MRWDDRIGRRLKLRDLHILLAVVQCGNMSKAARQLSVSNPVVTKAVADLEHALGVRLLDRTPRGVDLTVYGRALLDRGLAAFDELRQAVKHIEFLANPTAGEVRIACSLATSVGFIVAVIERLSRRFPRIVFNIRAGPEVDALRALGERTVDLVIGRMFSLTIEDHLNAEILYDDPFVVAAGMHSPWVRRRKIELAELVNEPWVLPPADSPFGSVIEEAFRAVGLKVPASTVIASAVPMRNALLASGRFLTIVPSSVLKFSGNEPTSKALPIELPIARRPIGAMTLKNRMLNPLAQRFIDCAREMVKPTTGRYRVPD